MTEMKEEHGYLFGQDSRGYLEENKKECLVKKSCLSFIPIQLK